MITDPIADYLTRIRNAIKARRVTVEIPASRTKKEITRVLHEQGYIRHYTFDAQSHVQGIIKITLKYAPHTKQPAIVQLQRMSKPGLRKYAGWEHIPEVINGLGIAILSTSKGVMHDKAARNMRVGGELLCYVY